MRTILCVEGEKAADAAWGIGLPAVCAFGGACAADKADWTPLAGRDVLIIPDNDDAGEKYAADVERNLLALTPPATVRVKRLGGAKGDDIFDWIEARQDVDAATLRAAVLE